MAVAATTRPTAPLRRSDLAGLERWVLHRGAFYKPDLVAVIRDGERIVVKDYAGKPWFVRALIGWAQIEWEARAYEALAGLGCVPAFRGRLDRNAFALEWVEGGYLCAAPDRRARARPYVRDLKAIAHALVARGFLHPDFRGIRNVLLRPDGTLAVLDLAGSLWVRPGSRLHRLLEPRLRRTYLRALLKWRRVLTAEVVYRDERPFWYKALFWLRQPHKVTEPKSLEARLREEKRRRML